jgi:hypothetical protein
VQPLFVVVADVVRDLGSGLFERKGHLGANALALDGFVITLQLITTAILFNNWRDSINVLIIFLCILNR